MALTAKYLKGCLMHYARYRKQMVVASEVNTGYCIADVMAYNDDKVVEIEVKVSKSDLIHDREKSKHEWYGILRNQKSDMIPNEFYYCVPDKLKDEAVSLSKQVEEVTLGHLRYGVMVCAENKNRKTHFDDLISVYYRPKKIHDTYPKKLAKLIVKRLCSEICRFYSKNIYEGSK
jgi:hypothetical protein